MLPPMITGWPSRGSAQAIRRARTESPGSPFAVHQHLASLPSIRCCSSFAVFGHVIYHVHSEVFRAAAEDSEETSGSDEVLPAGWRKTYSMRTSSQQILALPANRRERWPVRGPAP